VFDGGQRVGRNGETGNTAGHGAQDVCVVQCHLDAFVGVLVMHVVNAVEGIHVGLGKPVHHDVKLLKNVVVVENVAFHRRHLGSNLNARAFVLTAVNGVQEGLGKVDAGAEELPLLADGHGGHAAGNA